MERKQPILSGRSNFVGCSAMSLEVQKDRVSLNEGSFHLPHPGYNVMHNPQQEIRVAVVFGPGMKLRPVWFELNRRQHIIRQVTNSWLERRGETPLLHFHVTDDGALYELIYNMKDAVWKLAMVEAL